MRGTFRCQDCGLELEVDPLEVEPLARKLEQRFTGDCRLVFECADCGRPTEMPGGEVLGTLAWHARSCDRERSSRPQAMPLPGPGRSR